MSRPPIIVVTFIHISGPLKREEVSFSERRASGRGVILIGRDLSCDIRLPEDLPGVSRKHAHVVREGNKFKLVDHSKYGTYVRGKKVKDAEIMLEHGDVIEFSEGGPKVSFLMEIKEGEVDMGRLPPWPGKGVVKSAKLAESPQLPESPKIPESPHLPESPKPPGGPDSSPSPTSEHLSIQYGPSLRSFGQLPITIGRDPKVDFIVDHAAILDRHAQIFYKEGQYWVKDLTGQGLVRINGRPIGVQAPLYPNDNLALSNQGPVFHFIGEGRLFEAEESSTGGVSGSQETEKEYGLPASTGKDNKKRFSFIKKFLKNF